MMGTPVSIRTLKLSRLVALNAAGNEDPQSKSQAFMGQLGSERVQNGDMG